MQSASEVCRAVCAASHACVRPSAARAADAPVHLALRSHRPARAGRAECPAPRDLPQDTSKRRATARCLAVEQIDRVLEKERDRIVRLLDRGQCQVEQRRALLACDRLEPQPGKRAQRRECTLLMIVVNLEQGVVPEAALGLERIDQLLERQVLVALGLERNALDRCQQLRERLLPSGRVRSTCVLRRADQLSSRAGCVRDATAHAPSVRPVTRWSSVDHAARPSMNIVTPSLRGADAARFRAPP